MTKVAWILPSSGSMRLTRQDQGLMNTRRVQEELVLKIQTGGLTTQHDTEKRRKSFLIWPIFDRNFNLQMGKSFNFIWFYVFYRDPRRSEKIRVGPSWSDPDWQSKLIRSDFCTCLLTSGQIALGKKTWQINFGLNHIT